MAGEIEEGQINPEEEQSTSQSSKEMLAKMTTEEPEREVEIELAGGNGHKSYSESTESPNQTDLQATLKRLFPKLPESAIGRGATFAEAIMVGRIAPDVFLDMIYLNVTDIVEELEIEAMGDPEISISVQSIIDLQYVVYSIGLDGKGRIDALELHGSAKESEELERVSKGLGFS